MSTLRIGCLALALAATVAQAPEPAIYFAAAAQSAGNDCNITLYVVNGTDQLLDLSGRVEIDDKVEWFAAQLVEPGKQRSAKLPASYGYCRGWFDKTIRLMAIDTCKLGSRYVSDCMSIARVGSSSLPFKIRGQE